MQIVIDIPEKIYIHLHDGGSIGASLMIENAIKNGTLLPKGHGRLIDENELIDEIVCEEIDGRYYDVIYAHSIYDAETIIETESEDKE